MARRMQLWSFGRSPLFIIAQRQLSTTSRVCSILHNSTHITTKQNKGIREIDNCYTTIRFQSPYNTALLKHFNRNGYCSFSTKTKPDCAGKSDTKASAVTDVDLMGEKSQLGLFAKFKLMYKKYWYVLLPVHIITSVGWYGGFYYLCKSGVDIGSLLQDLHLNQSIIDKVQKSEMGNLALAYLCFKIATPLRYAVTLGGTTISIKYLVQSGYIKPMPTKKQLLTLYQAKYKIPSTAHKEAESQAGKMK